MSAISPAVDNLRIDIDRLMRRLTELGGSAR